MATMHACPVFALGLGRFQKLPKAFWAFPPASLSNSQAWSVAEPPESRRGAQTRSFGFAAGILGCTAPAALQPYPNHILTIS